ncbi:MAG: aspartate/glutamate racemase family protein [Thiolinea sp.]
MARILLINPNTTTSMTESMAQAARTILSPGNELIYKTSAYGPPSIEGYYDEVFSVPPLLELIRAEAEYDGVVIGCFDDTGVEAARCLADAPVMGICQAACHYASILADSFSIVTTLSRSVPALEKRVLSYGYERLCRSVRASDIPVLDLEHCDSNTQLQNLKNECIAALEHDGAEAIILGCAGMVNLQQQLQDELGVPVIEGVTAAVTLLEGMAKLPLQTSRRNAFAKPVAKTYSGQFAGLSPC